MLHICLGFSTNYSANKWYTSIDWFSNNMLNILTQCLLNNSNKNFKSLGCHTYIKGWTKNKESLSRQSFTSLLREYNVIMQNKYSQCFKCLKFQFKRKYVIIFVNDLKPKLKGFYFVTYLLRFFDELFWITNDTSIDLFSNNMLHILTQCVSNNSNKKFKSLGCHTCMKGWKQKNKRELRVWAVSPSLRCSGNIM